MDPGSRSAVGTSADDILPELRAVPTGTRPLHARPGVTSGRGSHRTSRRLDRARPPIVVRRGAVMTKRWERGIAAYASQFAIPQEDVWDHMCALVGERMAEEAITTAGAAWVDDCLSLRDRSLIVLAALITQGGLEARLRPHVRWALEHGATPEELEALAALLAVYTGFPRASVGVEVIRDELARLDAAND
jgi:4-carboxymuconolactone decarboxylase